MIPGLSFFDQGHTEADEKLLPVVYQELRKLASAKLSKRKPRKSIQPTLLVHETCVRLVDVDEPQQWKVEAISLERLLRRCGEYWWSMHGGSEVSNMVVDKDRELIAEYDSCFSLEFKA